MGSLSCLISPQLRQQPRLAPSGYHTASFSPFHERKGVFAPKSCRQVERGCCALCPGFAQPLGGSGTGLGTDEGFQSRFSDLKPMCGPVSFCVSQSMSWCAYLCMSFRVSTALCVNGGCEKGYGLCQQEGMSVSACVRVHPRTSVSVSE